MEQDLKDISNQLLKVEKDINLRLDKLWAREPLTENAFWIRIWSIVAISFITIVVSITLYNINNTNAVRTLIEKGVDPISAKCAIENNISSAMCTTNIFVKQK